MTFDRRLGGSGHQPLCVRLALQQQVPLLSLTGFMLDLLSVAFVLQQLLEDRRTDRGGGRRRRLLVIDLQAKYPPHLKTRSFTRIILWDCAMLYIHI